MRRPILIKSIFFVLLLFGLFPNMKAANWWDKIPLLNYSPRYFGVNAFPLPEMMNGKLLPQWEIELRGEYHTMDGDDTKDYFGRLYIPVVKGKAAVTVYGVITEYYKTSTDVRDERNAVEIKSPISCHGDVIIKCSYQALKSDKLCDVLVSMNLKTASGNRLCDARYTDAASYWFDVNVGKTLLKNPSSTLQFRVQALAGFYCWMTNDLVNRQNDAFCYGFGIQGAGSHVTLDSDISGFKGYRGDGDKPLVWRNKFNYELKNNIISLGYRHGIKDVLYDSFTIGYIRRF